MKNEVYDRETTTTNRQRDGDKSGSFKPSVDKQEVMKKMAAAGTPGPAHKALGAFVGNWKAEVSCWMEPDGPPTVSKAMSKSNWTLDGRFLEEEFHGEMMGTPFTGRFLMGFDNTKQKFTSVWVDSLHTSMAVSEGTGDHGYKVITLEGKMDCPGTSERAVPMKQVIHVLGQDKHVLEMFTRDEKSMEITYTRQKA